MNFEDFIKLAVPNNVCSVNDDKTKLLLKLLIVVVVIVK